MPRLDRRAVLVALAIGAFALFAWQGITTAGRSGPLDAGEYLLNAQYLDAKGWLPPAYISYEYSAPPLFEAIAVAAEHVVPALPSVPLELPWNLATRLLWLALVVGSALCLTAASGRTRWAGAAGLALGALWGLDEAIQLGRTEQWSSGQLLALGSALGLVVVSGLIAREIWPAHTGRALATAGFVLAYPVVLRVGALFHPETTMAFLSALVVWLVIRSERRGWPLGLGIAGGVLCGLDILTRQSAVVVVGCTLATALWVGRRQALSFVLAIVGGVVLLAGPWLGYAAYTWGNPLQGNLERSGGMLPGGEPLTFYTSTFPVRSLVIHPYREAFVNQLLPQLHADLWSDWFGVFHQGVWEHPPVLDRITASSQSVLGLACDALAIGGLVAFGVPMLIRVVRRRPTGPAGVAYAFLTLLTVVGFIAFVAQIVRYPQAGGKEIKASYLMFAAPAFAVFSVAAWLALTRRSRLVGIVLAVIAGLYVVSYPVSLASALGHHHPYDGQQVLPADFTYNDLTVSVPPSSGTAGLGTAESLSIVVGSVGTVTTLNVNLTIQLSSGMRLLGPPYSERGSGCTGLQTIVCPLDFLEPGMRTPVRFAVVLTRRGAQTVVATVTGNGGDKNPADNVGSVTYLVK